MSLYGIELVDTVNNIGAQLPPSPSPSPPPQLPRQTPRRQRQQSSSERRHRNSPRIQPFIGADNHALAEQFPYVYVVGNPEHVNNLFNENEFYYQFLDSHHSSSGEQEVMVGDRQQVNLLDSSCDHHQYNNQTNDNNYSNNNNNNNENNLEIQQQQSREKRRETMTTNNHETSLDNNNTANLRDKNHNHQHIDKLQLRRTKKKRRWISTTKTTIPALITKTVTSEPPITRLQYRQQQQKQQQRLRDNIIRHRSERNKYTVSMDDFDLLKVLGTGAYGKVFLVRKLTGHDEGKLYAMKVLRKEIVAQKSKTLDHTKTERKVLESIRNEPFLVTMHYAFQTKTKLHLILDYINGGELFTHLYQRDHFREDDVKIYVGELILALEKLHKVSVSTYNSLTSTH